MYLKLLQYVNKYKLKKLQKEKQEKLLLFIFLFLYYFCFKKFVFIIKSLWFSIIYG